jgi:phosphate uptake regulator
METRKIQSVGGGTYTVSIPKEWANAQNLTSGDTVELHRHLDGIFAIQAPECEQIAPTQITVQLSGEQTTPIERTVRAAYAAGTKTVRLEHPGGFTPTQRQTLDRVARTLTGVSVAEQSDTEIQVKTLLDTGEVSVVQSVRQLRFVVLSMHRDATAGLCQESDPAQFSDRDDQADRLYAIITRSFSRAIRRLDEVDALGLTRAELFELWETTRELERIGDHADGIVAASHSLDADEELVQQTREIADQARGIISDAVSVIIGESDVERAQRALDARDQLRERIRSVDGDGEALTQLRPVLNRLRRTGEHGGNIAEIALQRAIRTGELTTLSEHR